MKNKIAVIGIVIALLAVSIAIFQDNIRAFDSPPEVSITAKVINKGAEMLALKTTASSERYDAIAYTYIILGLLALTFAIVSYLQKENHRFSGMAAALGIIAIGWEYVLIGIIVAVVIFILANLDVSL